MMGGGSHLTWVIQSEQSCDDDVPPQPSLPNLHMIIYRWGFSSRRFLSPLCLPSSHHLLSPRPTGPGESAPIVIQPHATNSTSTPWAARRAVSGGPQSPNCVLKHVLIAGCIYHLSLSTSMLIMCINCGFLNAVVSSETHRKHQTRFLQRNHTLMWSCHIHLHLFMSHWICLTSWILFIVLTFF